MAEKIKILIVDDNENTREGTARLLEYEDNIEIVGFAENGAVAVDRVKELTPHVVLMDINMPVMNGIEATQQIQGIAPRTKVIMVSVQDDSQYLKQAFRAGAVDFVAKPITSAELAQAIERAYSSIQSEPAAPVPQAGMVQQSSGSWSPVMQMAARDGYVIGVVGYKGGTGKTTVAVNVALGLARSGKKTVLVDGNLLFGDISVFLNTRGQHNVVDIARLAAEPEQFDPEILGTVLVAHESGLKLLIAPANPNESEPVASETFVNLLIFLKREFEYVVVDTYSSTGFDGVLAAVIQSADRLVVLTTPTMPALKDARILLTELSSFEGALDKVSVVLNMIDRISRITPEQITNFLKQPIAAQIPFDPAAIEAVNQGIGLITLDPHRVPSVKPLMDMVQLIRNKAEAGEAQPVPEPQPAPRRGGLFGLGG